MSFKALMSYIIGVISMGIGIYFVRTEGRSELFLAGALVCGLIIAQIVCWLIHDFKRRQYWDNKK